MNHTINYLLCFFVLLFSLTISIGFANAEIECPQVSGNYTYINGSAYIEFLPFVDGDFSLLSCEYENQNNLVEPFGQVYALYNFTGELTPDMIVEFECGALLGGQFAPLFVSSSTQFASVAFAFPELIEAASGIMTQIEDQNIGQPCNEEIEEIAAEQIEEEYVEELDEEEIQEYEKEKEIQKENEKPSIEISNEEAKNKSIDDIVKELDETLQQEIPIKNEIEELSEKIILPDWIKVNAIWWSTDQIQDSDFTSGIEYMIEEGIIIIPPTDAATNASNEIPDWVKFNAGWWADDLISDIDFVNGLQYLISNGIISVA